MKREPMRPRLLGLFLVVAIMAACSSDRPLGEIDLRERTTQTADMLIAAQQAKLLAGDGAASDLFGRSVAISGDTAVVGAYGDDDSGGSSGSAYVFVRSGVTWTQQAKLLASDGAALDEFGRSVAVSGDTAVVGAYGDDDLGTGSGSAYVFVRSGVAWTQQAKLLASDGAASDLFGYSVAVSGDTAVVGAYLDDDLSLDSGSAYVFVRSGVTWTQQAKLLASDGAASDVFGLPVAVSGDTAVVAAYGDDDLGLDSGSAYVFVRSGVTWTQQAKLLASDGAGSDYFGSSVAVSGDTAVVGADFDDNLFTNSGSAYVFVRSGVTWTQQAKLLASDGAALDEFGRSVAVSGDTAVVGAYGDDDLGTSSGSAYVFVRSGVAWTQQAKLLASDGAASDQFGFSVAVSGDTAVVGAYLDDDLGTDSGSAYVFVLNGGPCATSADCGSAFCSDGVCCDSDCSGLCQACTAALKGIGSDGVCGNIVSGTDPQNQCSTATCMTGMCDGNGSCGNSSSGTACGDVLSCAAGTQTNADMCDGSGTCLDTGTTPCGRYTCGATSCNASCAADIDCSPGNFCSGTTCVAKLGIGSACGGTNQCQSDFCVDGVCCDAACSSTCSACSAAKKGAGTDGACESIQAGTDPDSECDDQGAATCGSNGFCDGAGACDQYASGTVCTAASCSDATTLVQADLCDENGACLDNGTHDCTPFACLAGACLTECTTSAQCAVSAYCDGSICIDLQGNGASCTDKGQCESGYCAAGVCCDSACDTGPCAACSIAGGAPTDGTCVELTATPCDDGNACTEADACQAGACMGTPVDCVPSDGCHGAGVCDPGNGACSNPTLADGTACGGKRHMPGRSLQRRRRVWSRQLL